jgi:hypothetical protein
MVMRAPCNVDDHSTNLTDPRGGWGFPGAADNTSMRDSTW